MKLRRRRKTGSNDGYLISFGDTMTALLAFFIVLNSLASEQTGANLYSGTGSFIRATDSLGVPGIFSEGLSSYSLQMEAASPLYLSESTDPESPLNSGPDAEGDTIFVRDRELENFERILNELERVHPFEKRKQIVGEVSFDRLSPLPSDADVVIDDEMKLLLNRLLPAIHQPKSRVEIVVWTPTPKASTFARSLTQAEKICRASQDYLCLPKETRRRLVAASRSWISGDVERPSLTVIIRKFQ